MVQLQPHLLGTICLPGIKLKRNGLMLGGKQRDSVIQ
jgi:hypothetical protein